MIEASAVRCPECDSERLYRDGLRYYKDSRQRQRWLCRNCGYRFTVQKGLNSPHSKEITRLVCALDKKAKNLTTAQEIEKICAGDGNLLNYAWLLKKKRGLADITINLRVSTLRLIQKKALTSIILTVLKQC